MKVKDVRGFEGLYMVTDEGQVISVYRQFRDRAGRLTVKESRVLAAPPDSNGYCVAHLYDADGGMKSVKVHRLVAEAFLGGSGEQVNHIDGCRDNNRATNLEYCSASGNQFHRHARKNHVALSATEITEVRDSYGKVPTKILAGKFNVDRSTIYRLAHGGRHKNAKRAAARLAKADIQT